MVLESINPATGRLVRNWEELSPSDVRDLLGASRRAFLEWSRTPLELRAGCLRRAAGLLRANTDPLSRLMAQEMGKPLPQGRSEVEKCAWVCEHYAEHGASMLADQAVPMEGGRAFIAFRPLGTVLAVMPWNFPFWQVFRFAAPNLMGGNTGLLKHAGNVQGCAAAIESILHEAGFPADVFRNVPVSSAAVADLIRAPEVAAVTLTGSTPAGKAVAHAAADVLKKTVLELGGSDPYVVLADADVERAAETCVASRLINTGQSCIAAKRFIVVEPVREAFTQAVLARMAARSMDDPLQREDTDLGPMARADLRDELHGQVTRSVQAGAQLLLGGRVPDGPGAFYPATVLAGVRKGMPTYSEETFGPVASILPARDEDEALAIANDTCFGLGAAVFTADVARGERIASERLEAGCCSVNDFVRSDPRLPFGGIKESGYGRELAAFGMREFLNVKSVAVKP
jgi:succinate-semialdehyde dehydrogenase/glutarate-semialdehyde dehydrogenase